MYPRTTFKLNHTVHIKSVHMSYSQADSKDLPQRNVRFSSTQRECFVFFGVCVCVHIFHKNKKRNTGILLIISIQYEWMNEIGEPKLLFERK